MCRETITHRVLVEMVRVHVCLVNGQQVALREWFPKLIRNVVQDTDAIIVNLVDLYAGMILSERTLK